MRVIVALLTVVLGACAGNESVDGDREPIGPDTKADAITGSCAAADTCDGRSNGTCYCDDTCADFGDCCEDKGPVCGGATNRLENRIAGLTPQIAFSETSHKVADLPYPPGNVAVSPAGRVFLSYFPDGNKGDAKVVELVNGTPRPFPSNMDVHGDLKTVLGIRLDQQGRLWILDHGMVGLHRPKLLAVDIATQQIVVSHTFSFGQAGIGSLLNDVVVSPDGKTVFVVDQSYLAQHPAILVIELNGNSVVSVKRRLEDHESVSASGHDVFINGNLIFFKKLRPQWTVDGIALSADGSQFYFAGFNSGKLYRMPTSLLRTGTDAQIEQFMATGGLFANITATDGIITDPEGNVYLTDMEHSAVTKVSPDGILSVVAKHARLRWPDGFAWGPDRSLYVTCSALHTFMNQLIVTDSHIESNGPYQLYRFKL